jgi:phosphate:Na+ symporter
LEEEITKYITQLLNEEMTPRTGIKLRSILNIANDLERIGDIYFQIGKTMEKKNDSDIYFTQDQRDGLNKLMDLVDEAFVIMNENLNAPHYDDVNIDPADDKEDEINKYRKLLRKENLRKLNSDEDYNPNSAMIYTNMFSLLEKVGDHIINVSESVVGEI